MTFTKAAALAAFLALGAGAAGASTLTITEGNGSNRATIAGSVDLNVDSSGAPTNLDALNGGSFGFGDTIGIYGRIVNAVDQFAYSFSSNVGFDVVFDFDGYDLEGGGSVAAGYSGLIDQSVVVNSTDPTTTGGKGVVISIYDAVTNTLIDSISYITNITSATTSDATIFANLAAGDYRLVVDGRQGPATNRAALYDILVVADVPLPAGSFLFLSGLGGLALIKRKKA